MKDQNRRDIVGDYIDQIDPIKEFFAGNYRDRDSYLEKIKQVQRSVNPDLLQILFQQNQQFGAGEKTFENIQKLKQHNALTVVTGQQVGLATGPLYTIYKALATIRLARQVETWTGNPVVPVFYLVTEDHDYDEVRWLGVLDQFNHFNKLSLPEKKDNRLPVSQISLEQISPVIEKLDSFLPETEYKVSVLDALRKEYAEGTSMSLAFSRFFARIFKSYGIIQLDSSDPKVKPLMLPVLQKELEERITLQVMPANNARLVQLGYHNQLSFQENRPGVFYLQEGRHGLEWNGHDYLLLKDRQTISLQLLLKNPEQLSPKVTLRPIVQDFLFPTIAYVGGPGEIAYWAQLKPLYDRFGIEMPLVVPRAGFTLIESKIRRLLEKNKLTAQQVIDGPDVLLNSLAERIVPDDIKAEFTKTSAIFSEMWDDLTRRTERIDPVSVTVMTRTKQNILQQLDSTESKIKKMVSQKEEIVLNQFKSISNNLVPEKKLQERQLNVVPYLVKFGWEFIDRLYDQLETFPFEHKLLEL